MTILMTGGDPIRNPDCCDRCGWPLASCDCYWDEDLDAEYDDDLPCTWCGGEGVQENDDPLWYGFDVDDIPCVCCDGTGLRSHQTIF